MIRNAKNSNMGVYPNILITYAKKKCIQSLKTRKIGIS